MRAVRVVRNFSANVAPSHGTQILLEFHEGQIVSNPQVIQTLEATGLMKERYVVDTEDTTTSICPKCRALVNLSTDHIEAVQVRSARAGFTYGGSFFTYKLGDLEWRPWLVNELRNTDTNLDNVTASHCKACDHAFV